MALLPVDEALSRVLAGVAPLASESVPLTAARGRTLAENVIALLTQPPFDSSAMDGYAVAARDLAKTPAALTVSGESQAGRGYARRLLPGEAVRIFTGAPLPAGADTVVIQENTEREGAHVLVREAPKVGANVRPAGSDFRQGQMLLAAGTALDASAVTLAAAAGHATLNVRSKPRVAILATGDELVEPDVAPGTDQIVSSNPYGLSALIERAGGTVQLLGIAGDTEGAIAERLDAAAGADVLVTIGGASVGDRDLVRPALEARGMTLDFWKVAIRPGKPMLFGVLGPTRVLGLPGNPLSCLIAARVFLVPLLYRLLGRSESGTETFAAALAGDLNANGERRRYIPARLSHDKNGLARVTAFAAEDSARLTGLVGADVLIVREVGAPTARAGTVVSVLPADF